MLQIPFHSNKRKRSTIIPALEHCPLIPSSSAESYIVSTLVNLTLGGGGGGKSSHIATPKSTLFFYRVDVTISSHEKFNFQFEVTYLYYIWGMGGLPHGMCGSWFFPPLCRF